MRADIDYDKYYNLEQYVFSTVRNNFISQKNLKAFDFFSILIWKAGRAKTHHVKRLLKDKSLSENLDSISEKITSEIYNADNDKHRLEILMCKAYGFHLPTASAILSVLYPKTFSVYDYRVCEQLEAFHELVYITDTEKVWNEYQKYLVAVKDKSGKSDLREADKYLWGKSAYEQLEKDIKANFKILRNEPNKE